MAKYVQKFAVVEAIQFTGYNFREIKEFLGGSLAVHCSANPEPYITFRRNIFGVTAHANKGDYITGDLFAGFNVHEKEAFEQNYMKVEEV
ncbi:hypothetical protein J32TS2_28520 [Shouchella clausii]|uniref:hypothetical protein n=1 Tax=Shouchella clausii TaxID=79880 RepID=UPI001B2F3663|nr:hypothetical protein [Shouchella clausii]GIN17496.1 hypothetical protein J32TS2_28520 [Shouchella clausii]